MNIFVDTSALVKYFHEEKGTNAVTNLIDNHENMTVVSELSKIEILSALQRRYRRRELDKQDLEEAIEAFYNEFSTFHIEPISRLITQEAEKLLLQYGNKYNLRTLDAIQMSTFILLVENENWLFVASDNNLTKTVMDWGAKTFNPLDEEM